MIAAARRRIGAVFSKLAPSGPRRWIAASTGPPIAASSEPHPRAGRGWPNGCARDAGARLAACAGPAAAAAGGVLVPRPRPRRALAAPGRRARRCAARPAASAVLTPQRAIGGVDRRLRRSAWSSPSSSTTAASRSASRATPACPSVARPPTVDVEDRRRRPLLPAGPGRRCSPPSLGVAGACAASGRGLGRVVVALGLLSDRRDPARRPARRPRRGRPGLALRRRHGGARRRLLRRARGSGGAGSWPDCSTMRGRAEYESTCQEGPQAPEEEDDDAGPQVGPGSQEGASPRRSGAASAPASRP